MPKPFLGVSVACLPVTGRVVSVDQIFLFPATGRDTLVIDVRMNMCSAISFGTELLRMTG